MIPIKRFLSHSIISIANHLEETLKSRLDLDRFICATPELKQLKVFKFLKYFQSQLEWPIELLSALKFS